MIDTAHCRVDGVRLSRREMEAVNILRTSPRPVPCAYLADGWGVEIDSARQFIRRIRRKLGKAAIYTTNNGYMWNEEREQWKLT